jgi:O-antigen/teichoic acid export membrane protein
MSNRILKNISFVVLDKVIAMCFALIVGVLVARYLGPEKYGTLNYLVSIIAILSAFSRFGLNNIVVRELVNRKSEVNSILSASFYIKLVASISIYIISSIVIYSFNSDLYIFFLIIAFAILIQSFEVVQFYFSSQLLSKYVSYANIISNISSSLLKICLIIFSLSLIYFIFSYVLTVFISILLTFFYAYRKALNLKIFTLPAKGEVIYFLKMSLPIYVASISAAIFMKSDQVMLGNMRGMDEVALYAVAVQLTTAFYFVSTAISSSFLPVVIDCKGNPNKYKKTIELSMSLLLVISVSIALFLSFGSDLIVKVLFGELYKDSGIILSLYAWLNVFIALEGGLNNYIIAENLQKYIMFNNITGALFNIILNLFLIPIYGAKGAVIASIISYFVSHYIMFFIFEKTRPIIKIQHSSILNLFKLRTYRYIYIFILNKKVVENES